MSSFKIAVFVSGNGSNLQCLIDTKKINNEHSLDIAVVFSNNKDALALKRAKKNNIPKCIDIIKRSNLFICVGSSLCTGDDNLLNLAVECGSKTIEINPQETLYSHKFCESYKKTGYDGLLDIYNNYKNSIAS